MPPCGVPALSVLSLVMLTLLVPPVLGQPVLLVLSLGVGVAPQLLLHGALPAPLLVAHQPALLPWVALLAAVLHVVQAALHAPALE